MSCKFCSVDVPYVIVSSFVLVSTISNLLPSVFTPKSSFASDSLVASPVSVLYQYLFVTTSFADFLLPPL